MGMEEAYQQRIDSDLKQAQRTLDASTAQSKSLTEEDRIRYNRWIEELQKKTEAAQAKLREWATTGRR
jgi:hypothetical protein